MILKIFLFWRIGILAITFLGASTFPLKANGGLGSPAANKAFNYLDSWAQWDGGHYYQIAREGYQTGESTAFFPLYPILTRTFSVFTNRNLILSGLAISNLSMLLFLYFFYSYCRKKYNKLVAKNALVTFLLFPTTFFAVAMYSESLFLLLTILTFNFLEKKNYLFSAIYVALASTTRIVGVALIISWLYNYFSEIKFKIKNLDGRLLYLLISPIGVLIYLFYLFNKFGDPFRFLIANQIFWQRSITDPISTVLSYLWSALITNSLTFNDYLDVTLTLIFIGLLIYGAKKIPSSLWIFSVLVLLIPISSGTLTSMPRYVLSSIGAFIIIGKLLAEKPKLKIPIWFAILVLQIYFSILFINGYWIA